MPELPEVQTIVGDLNKKVRGLAITGVWTDWPNAFRRSPGGWKNFEPSVKGRKIEKVRRLGKNIIFDLSGGEKMLIHQKMTGHLLIGRWRLDKNRPVPEEQGLLSEKVNGYIHTLFYLSGGKMMAFSDLRKFGKIIAAGGEKFSDLEDVKNIGPDLTAAGFSFFDFKKALAGRRGPIKKVLMDQSVVSGIGNIYSDEILFVARIHPLKKTENLSDVELRKIFSAAKKILKKAIKLRGTSISDYRDTAGKAGGYDKVRLVYRKEGAPCPDKCGGKVRRIKIGGRSAHFCPHCQKL